MPESLSSPQMLGNAPAHITLSSNATDLIRQLFQHQQALHLQQQQQQQLQQKQKNHKKHAISDVPSTTASTTSASATIRSTSSSPDGSHERGAISPEGDEEDIRPESVGSSSPQSPPPAASTSRSSSRGTNTNNSNNPNSIRPQRKLKIYGVEEKLDIIDYAKIIGNRAAGREYNVAESSIREWRKNETKLRTQAENARSTQNPNIEKEAFYEKLYGALVTYINTEGEGITWKMVRDKCKELWDKWGNGFPEGQVSMHLQGWVARFIQKARQSKDIPEVPPPIPSTNSSTSTINGITMVPSTSTIVIDLSTPSSSSSSSATTSATTVSTKPNATVSQPPPAKRSRLSTATNSSNESNSTTKVSRDSTSSTSKSLKSSTFVTPQITSKSRRKNIAPKRVNDATLKTSTTLPLDLSTRKNAVDSKDAKKLSSDVENDDDNAIEVC